MLVRTIRLLAVGLCALGFGLSAQAGPAMFNASFIMHSWGNDITSGATYPYNDNVFTAAPLGHNCQHAQQYSVNGATNSRWCSDAIFSAGAPATGSGTLTASSTAVLTVGATVALPTSAFVADVTGFLPTYYPYLQSWTYGYFQNVAGTFFAGGGAAAGLGEATKTGMGQTSGTWIIHEGPNAFGGVLGVLGAYGAIAKYVVSGKPGTYEGTGTWAMIPEVGRPQSATPVAYSGMGKTTKWQNPWEKTNAYVNNVNSNISSLVARGTGTLWTTGTVSVLAQAGVFQTVLKRTGYDVISGSGATAVRNIQLVTPTLTHWVGPGYQTHTGQVGILKLTITPEPEVLLMLAAGGGLLALLYWTSRRG
jgi:hypothetical protein